LLFLALWFVYRAVPIHGAITLVREICKARHLSINTDKTHTYWLTCYGVFLKQPKLKSLTVAGISGSTETQACNALRFYSNVLKQELGPVDSHHAAAIRQCLSQKEGPRLLSAVSDLNGQPRKRAGK
jgi:hypothetical protein